MIMTWTKTTSVSRSARGAVGATLGLLALCWAAAALGQTEPGATEAPDAEATEAWVPTYPPLIIEVRITNRKDHIEKVKRVSQASAPGQNLLFGLSTSGILMFGFVFSYVRARRDPIRHRRRPKIAGIHP